MQKTILTAVALAVGLVVAACNTVQGAGEDVQSAGNAVSKTAEDVKN